MSVSQQFHIQPLNESDGNWLTGFITKQWGADFVVIHNEIIYPAQKSGFATFNEKKECVGLLTWQINNDELEIITLDSLLPGKGIASQLIQTAINTARNSGCRRLWLITTNDNLNALGFYQKRGFHIRAIYPRAVKQSRKLKPSIPLIAENGIAIRDEIELELFL